MVRRLRDQVTSRPTLSSPRSVPAPRRTPAACPRTREPTPGDWLVPLPCPPGPAHRAGAARHARAACAALVRRARLVRGHGGRGRGAAAARHRRHRRAHRGLGQAGRGHAPAGGRSRAGALRDRRGPGGRARRAARTSRPRPLGLLRGARLRGRGHPGERARGGGVDGEPLLHQPAPGHQRLSHAARHDGVPKRHAKCYPRGASCVSGTRQGRALVALSRDRGPDRGRVHQVSVGTGAAHARIRQTPAHTLGNTLRSVACTVAFYTWG